MSRSGLLPLSLLSILAAACSPETQPIPDNGVGFDAGPFYPGPGTGVDASLASNDNLERCGNGLDDNSNGQVDEQCPCTPGQSQSCWPGDPEKRGNGPCIDGSQECVPSGEFGTWGTCLGAIIPANLAECTAAPHDPNGQCIPNELGEVCNDNRDGDCDGLFDCQDPDCAAAPNCPGSSPDNGEDGCRCVPGSTRFCHVPGPCTWGMATCNPDGSWGACSEADPSVVPSACAGGGFGDDFFGDFGFGSDYDAACCVAQGFCCDNQDYDYSLYDPTQPTHASVGNCAAVCAP